MKNRKTILEIKDFSVTFQMYCKGLKRKESNVINHINLSVQSGEILAVVGSSGSGKSILAHAILGLLPDNAVTFGTMSFYDKNLTKKLQKKLRGKKIAFVPQSVEYLDPLMKVAKQVRGNGGNIKKQKQVFQRLGLSEKVEAMYPFQLSGGMARRILIASAIMEEAELLIADEPTPGLSEKMAKEAMKSFRELAEEGKGILFITHDMDLAFEYADRIAVFYGGTIVECASVEDFKKGREALRHPYTKALWEALPQNGFKSISGNQPNTEMLLKGCVFAARCKWKSKECEGSIPTKTIRQGEVKCIHAT